MCINFSDHHSVVFVLHCSLRTRVTPSTGPYVAALTRGVIGSSSSLRTAPIIFVVHSRLHYIHTTIIGDDFECMTAVALEGRIETVYTKSRLLKFSLPGFEPGTFG